MSVEFGKHTPFVLIARIKIKPDCVDEYLTLAEQTDKLVNDTEPGMLHHTFDSDPDDPDKFVWSEVYANDQAFIDHLNNPCVGTYLEKHADLALSFEVEIFGTLSEDTKDRISTLNLPVKYYESHYGFSRCEKDHKIIKFIKNFVNWLI